MTKHYDAIPPYVEAAEGMVLCDGNSMTGLGGRVYAKNTASLDLWQEMTEDEAAALVPSPEDEGEATEADYQDALNDLGVTFDEEI